MKKIVKWIFLAVTVFVTCAFLFPCLKNWIMNQPTVPPVTVERDLPVEEANDVEVVQIGLGEVLEGNDFGSEVETDDVVIAMAGQGTQPIQVTPEMPDEPDEKPELKEGADLTNPEKMPEYVQQPKQTEKPDDTVVTKPPTDDVHPGQIYVEGFGWIDRGRPNETIIDTEIYMNGNKIGDM